MSLRCAIQNIKSLRSIAYSRPFIQASIKTNNYSSYASSKPEGDPEQYTKYEITKNPEEWKYVERYLSKLLIPEPPVKERYPSGWTPVKAKAEDFPYFVERTKNHLLPVYLLVTHRGLMKETKVRRISGDLWLFKEELLKYLGKVNKNNRYSIGVKVDEIGGGIKLRGDHVNDVKDWLLKKGF